MQLSVSVTGNAGAQPPVLVTHGLFGQSRNLGVIIRALSDTRQVLAVDLRNHGDSPWDDRHDYDALASDLAQVIEDHGGQADVVGHSMGGKASMRLATTRGDLVRRVVVLDIAPIAYGHSQADLVDAMQSADFTSAKTRGQADMALAQQVEDHSVRAFLLQSLDLKSEPPRWRMNLEALRAQMDKLTGWPEGGTPFEGPVLVLRGGESDYVDARGEAAIRELLPNAVVETVAGCTHWLHAEKPEPVSQRIAEFLNG